MNFIIDMVLLYIFMTFTYFVNIPDLQNENFLRQQLITFMMLIIYYTAIQIIVCLFQKRRITPSIISKSYNVALAGFIGIVIFTDLRYMNWSSPFMNQLTGYSGGMNNMNNMNNTNNYGNVNGYDQSNNNSYSSPMMSTTGSNQTHNFGMSAIAALFVVVAVMVSKLFDIMVITDTFTNYF